MLYFKALQYYLRLREGNLTKYFQGFAQLVI